MRAPERPQRPTAAATASLDSRDWRQALLPAAGHGGQRVAPLCRKAAVVEQRQVAPVVPELIANLGQGFADVGPAHGHFFAICRVVHCQLGQAHGVEQAGRHARGEAAASLGEQRQAHPQRVAAGGVRAIRKGVEKHIGQGQPGQVLGGRDKGRKHQPRGCYAALGSLLAQGLLHAGLRCQQPQHAA